MKQPIDGINNQRVTSNSEGKETLTEEPGFITEINGPFNCFYKMMKSNIEGYEVMFQGDDFTSQLFELLKNAHKQFSKKTDINISKPKLDKGTGTKEFKEDEETKEEFFWYQEAEMQHQLVLDTAKAMLAVFELQEEKKQANCLCCLPRSSKKAVLKGKELIRETIRRALDYVVLQEDVKNAQATVAKQNRTIADLQEIEARLREALSDALSEGKTNLDGADVPLLNAAGETFMGKSFNSMSSVSSSHNMGFSSPSFSSTDSYTKLIQRIQQDQKIIAQLEVKISKLEWQLENRRNDNQTIAHRSYESYGSVFSN